MVATILCGQLGIYATANQTFLIAISLAKKNPLIEWKDVFGIGSHPVNDSTVYPTYDEMLATYDSVRADTLAYLDTITDDDLDKPSHAPEDRKEYFGTIGQCLTIMTTHLAFHGGQIADARRASGREILMA